MIETERIPAVLKCVVMVPVYKGDGKDPLTASICRDVVLTSVIAKVLEFLVLQRLQVIFRHPALQPDSLSESNLMYG